MATLPDGDINNRELPLMNNLISNIGLEDILNSHGIEHNNTNFEELYDDLSTNGQNNTLLHKIENKTREYFKQLQLPSKATIYDYLILSLREKDLIASFNWDPLLVQAAYRNRTLGTLPKIVFMHGNVGIGICEKHRRMGYLSQNCQECNEPFESCALLYPVKRKNYQINSYIEDAWNTLNNYLSEAYYITIFGYSAPETDIEAKELLLRNWQSNKSFELAEIEIIDIKDEIEIEETWSKFLFKTHYSIKNDIFSSYLFNYPRRSCEAFASATLMCAPWKDRPFPEFKHFIELQEWILPLIEKEKQHSFHENVS